MVSRDFAPIALGSPDSRSGGAKFLDALSSVFLEPKTIITKGFGEAGKLVAKRRKKIRGGDTALGISTIFEIGAAASIPIAATLGIANPAAAAKIAAGLIPKTIGGKIGAITVGGVLITSKTAREQASKFIADPTKIGREAGILIDKAAKGEETGSVVDALKTAGIIGGTAALVGGAAIVGKKALDKFKTPITKIETPSTVPSSIALPTSVIPTSLQAITEPQPVVAKTAPAVLPKTGQDINIKRINKPQLNVAVAQSI